MKTGLTNRRAVDQAESFRQCGGASGGAVPGPTRFIEVLGRRDGAFKPAFEPAAFRHGKTPQKGEFHTMAKFLILTMLSAQPPKAEKPMALDPITQRRVYEAFGSANIWAKSTSESLYRGKDRVKLPVRQQIAFIKAKRNARYNLLIGSMNQICAAYGIDRKTLYEVIRDPRSEELKFVRELNGKSGIKMATSPRDFDFPTRFDPGLVVLPEKIAKRIGYENPPPPRERKPLVIPRGLYLPRRAPGEPQEHYDDKHREEVERFIEIRDRAAKTKFKDPIPLSPNSDQEKH
jgi:hypothetical protein